MSVWLVGGGLWLIVRWWSPSADWVAGHRSVGVGSVTPGYESGLSALITPGLLGVAAVLAFVDVDGLWWPVLWCVLALLLGLAVRGAISRGAIRREAVDDAALTPVGATSVAATSVVVLALLMALLSLVMVRPDRDDVFVVNRSTWVAEHDAA